MDELSYNGKNFSEFNTFFDGSKAFGSPEKDYELVEIMGRNGSLSIYNDRFKDILLPFPCFVRSSFLTHYRQLVEFLNSQHGYLRLETSKEPNHFRKALFQGIVEPQTTPFNHGGQFTINFLAKPQRFLKSGETPVSSQSQDEEYEGNPSVINNPSGLSNVKSLEVGLEPIQNLNGYANPWVGGAGKNKANPNLVFVTRSTTLNDPSAGDEVTTDANGKVTYTFTSSGRGFSVYIGYYENGTTVTVQCKVGTGCGLYRILKSAGIPSTGTEAGTIVQSVYSGDGDVTTTFTANETAHYWAAFYKSGQTSPATAEYIQAEIGSPATAYEPYENVCPITGHTEVNAVRTGKNLIPRPYYNSDGTRSGIVYATQDDGSVNISGSTSTSQSVFYLFNDASYKGLFIGKTMTFSVDGFDVPSTANTVVQLTIQYITGGVKHRKQITPNGLPITFTLGNDEFISDIFIRIGANTSITGTKNVKVQLEVGSATDYEPYTSTTYTSSLGTTVYGGSLDIVSGLLTVTHATVTLDSTMTWQTVGSSGHGWQVLNSSLPANPKNTGANYADGVYCDRLKPLVGASTVADNLVFINSSGVIRVNTADIYADKSAMFTALGNIQVSYPLATPITYQLTPTQVSLLTGVNVISTDGNGDMTVTVTEPSLLVNPTLFESKPLLRIYGTGTVNINDKYITTTAHSFPYIDIDCELMDAFYGSSNANQYVTFSDNDYITLKSGNNYIAYGNQIEVTPRWFEI